MQNSVWCATIQSGGVDYENIGIWLNDARPMSIQVLERQTFVTEDTVGGANKLMVRVESSRTARSYFSGLFSRRPGIPALAQILAEHGVLGFNGHALQLLESCMQNKDAEYDGEQVAAVSLFRAIESYLNFVTLQLRVDDREGKIRHVRELIKIMLQESDVGSRLSQALTYANTELGKKISSMYIPLPGARVSKPQQRFALQKLLNVVRDTIRNSAAHSEMIALYHVFCL